MYVVVVVVVVVVMIDCRWIGNDGNLWLFWRKSPDLGTRPRRWEWRNSRPVSSMSSSQSVTNKMGDNDTSAEEGGGTGRKRARDRESL